MWKCFWRRRGRAFRLIYFGCLFLFLVIAKHYIHQENEHQGGFYSIIPKLKNWDQEKQRLYDHLSQIKMICKVAKSVGEESMALPVCLETKTGKKLMDKFTLITVDESKNLFFEIGIENMWKKANVLKLTSKNNESLFMNLKKNLGSLNDTDIVILKLSNYASDYIEPKVIQKLSENRLLDRVQMMFIYIHLTASHSRIFNWYSVLMSLYLNFDLQLYHVSKNLKTCFDNLEISDCTVITSWLKQPDTKIEIPQLMVSEIDQTAQLFNLLTQSYNCSKLTFYNSIMNVRNRISNLASYILPKRWPICISFISTPCNIYSAIYGYNLDHYINDFFNCTIHLFDPALAKQKSTRNLVFHNWGIAAKNNSMFSSIASKEQLWSFRKASEVIGNRKSTIDVLHLDLHGGEWEVLQELVSNNGLKNVNQIIASVHLWYGEEFFNQIGHFFTLQKLSQFGFEIYFVEEMIDSSNIELSTPTEKCCFVIGWIKRKN